MNIQFDPEEYFSGADLKRFKKSYFENQGMNKLERILEAIDAAMPMTRERKRAEKLMNCP